VLTTTVTATIGVIFLAGGLHGYLLTRASIIQRIMLIAAAFSLIKPGLGTDLAGVGLGTAVLVLQVLARRREAPDASGREKTATG
jgi:TRAP-type uncharacterized transport system fused permease subunit